MKKLIVIFAILYPNSLYSNEATISTHKYEYGTSVTIDGWIPASQAKKLSNEAADKIKKERELEVDRFLRDINYSIYEASKRGNFSIKFDISRFNVNETNRIIVHFQDLGYSTYGHENDNRETFYGKKYIVVKWND